MFGRRYRVTEKIGSGGMADVYKAVDEVLGRTVAVKVLHPRYAADPTFVARFRQEAQAAANLSNPHIVNIYDWGQEDSTYYIVMEYVRGTDLKALDRREGPGRPRRRPPSTPRRSARRSPSAHGYDIVHRDIKPHNIVLMPDGTIKVMDFGIARAGNTTMTQTGSVLGTAQYISPEQAQGRPLGPSSDLYSLGVVLYELTTGPPAVRRATRRWRSRSSRSTSSRVPPRQLNPAIPPALEAVILHAMQKDPAQRYTSADEMRDDLRRVIAGQPVAAAPAAHGADERHARRGRARRRTRAARRARPVEPKRRNAAWAWVLALIALVLIGGLLAWARVPPAEERRRARRDEPARRARRRPTIAQAGLEGRRGRRSRTATASSRATSSRSRPARRRRMPAGRDGRPGRELRHREGEGARRARA